MPRNARRRVREKHQQNYLYILMLTMRGSVADFVSGMQCGADAYVRKTADDQELLAQLYTAQRIIRLERDSSAARVTDSLLGIHRRAPAIPAAPPKRCWAAPTTRSITAKITAAIP